MMRETPIAIIDVNYTSIYDQKTKYMQVCRKRHLLLNGIYVYYQIMFDIVRG